jgi:hypothetical protein
LEVAFFVRSLPKLHNKESIENDCKGSVEKICDRVSQGAWHQDFPRQPGFDPGSGQMGFVVDKVALRQVFSEHFGFPCQSSIHQIFHHHNHPGQATIGQSMASAPSGPIWTPPPTKQIKKWALQPNQNTRILTTSQKIQAYDDFKIISAKNGAFKKPQPSNIIPTQRSPVFTTAIENKGGASPQQPVQEPKQKFDTQNLNSISLPPLLAAGNGLGKVLVAISRRD